jgi:hypothetical protein
MTPQQIRDAIAASPALQAHQAAGNHAAIAAALSVGRTKPQVLEITERGVRAILGDVEGARFMRLMEAIKDAATTDTVPAWLAATLTAIGRQADTHVLTLDTMGIAFDWLKKEPGLDIGDPETQKLLDLIAMGYASTDPKIPACCAALKARAPQLPDPITAAQVEAAVAPPPATTWTGEVLEVTRSPSGMVSVRLKYTSSDLSVAPILPDAFSGDGITPAYIAAVIAARCESLQKADAALALFGG